MGALPNPNHERFAREVADREEAGETLSTARTAAYRAHILKGDATDEQIKHNARRLANSAKIRARIKERRDLAARIADIDKAWMMVTLKGTVEANLDDYCSLTANGDRVLDLKKATREQMGFVAELSQEEETVPGLLGSPTVVRKVKFKLHPKLEAARLMIQMMGWNAPQKVAPTNPAGDGPAVVHHEFGEIDSVRRAVAVLAEESERMAAEQAAGEG